MKLLKPLLLIGGALLVYGALKASKFFKNLSIEFQQISLGGSVLEPKVFATMKVHNKENFDVNISDIKGSLYYQNKYLADVLMRNTVNVKPNSVVYIDIELSSLLPDVLQFITLLIKSKQITEQFKFDGSLKINGIQIPYKSVLSW